MKLVHLAVQFLVNVAYGLRDLKHCQYEPKDTQEGARTQVNIQRNANQFDIQSTN